MQLYNIEFFTKELKYVGSQQISDIDFEFDYLSPDENSINISFDTKCNIGNFIQIKSLTNEELYIGTVTTVNETNSRKTVKFKSLLNLFDVPVVVGTMTGTVEQWITDKIKETYVNNSDKFQNIKGLKIKANSSTTGTIDTEDYIINLLEMVGYLLKKYNIVVSFGIDFEKNNINIVIDKNTNVERVIEADLPNILDKTIEVKTNEIDDNLNKITLINTSEEGANETVTYYRDIDGNVTTNPTNAKRITPVVFTIKTMDCKSEEFDDKALETATKDLAEDEYNNLIEITVKVDDDLVHPELYKIGQKVLIISNNKQYVSYLTGYSIKNATMKLIFGAIRLELTKKLKRRLRNEY